MRSLNPWLQSSTVKITVTGAGGWSRGPRAARRAGELQPGGRELMAMNLRCMLRGHTWGPVEGLERGAIRTCTCCGKVKHVHADPPPEIHDIGR